MAPKTINRTEKEDRTDNRLDDICATVNPGICGFPCIITARKLDARSASLKISGSECKQILSLAKRLNKMTMPELFAPISRNPAYLAAEKSGCHPSCVIPAAVLKAVEAALDMALPREIHIRIEPCREKTNAVKPKNCTF